MNAVRLTAGERLDRAGTSLPAGRLKTDEDSNPLFGSRCWEDIRRMAADKVIRYGCEPELVDDVVGDLILDLMEYWVLTDGVSDDTFQNVTFAQRRMSQRIPRLVDKYRKWGTELALANTDLDYIRQGGTLLATGHRTGSEEA